jgi:hypothetical protein
LKALADLDYLHLQKRLAGQTVMYPLLLLMLAADQKLDQAAQKAMLLLMRRHQMALVLVLLQQPAGQMVKIQTQHYHPSFLHHLNLDMCHFLSTLNLKPLLLEEESAVLLYSGHGELFATFEIALLLPFQRLLIHL